MVVENIDIILKYVFLSIFSILIFMKVTNYKDFRIIKNICIVVTIIVLSIINFLCKKFFDVVSTILIIYLTELLLLKMITKLNFSTVIIGSIIAVSTTYILGAISSFFEFFIQILFNIDNNTINMLITSIIEFGFIEILVKNRRIKNGLNLLKEGNEYIDIAVININLILVVMYGLISYSNDKIYEYVFLYYVIFGLLAIVMVQRSIEMLYRQKVTKRTIEDYGEMIKLKDAEIKNLTDENFRISKINHEFYNRQKALELMVQKRIENSNMETAEELEILSRIKEITEEHSAKMSEIKLHTNLQLTEIKEIDDMFSYMQKECEESNIKFKLQLNGNIHYMINNLIEVNKLETMIGDHIRDAIIAVNSSNNTNKEIFVILGSFDEFYGLSVLDTGIEFEIETLLKLGIEPATTHKETGGTGIGFNTTFETLKECKASIEIEEKHPANNTDYTKAVKFIFDGKNEYRIKSYRAEQIKQAYNGDRIIISNL